METGTPVWLHSPDSSWGWLPARIAKRENVITRGRNLVKLILVDDFEVSYGAANNQVRRNSSKDLAAGHNGQTPKFETTLTIDPMQKDHPEIKVRNTPKDSAANCPDNVDDLISLPHLHEPAILHSLRLRYEEDVIYTATGPILIAVNPFKGMEGVYGEDVMEGYRVQGEGRAGR